MAGTHEAELTPLQYSDLLGRPGTPAFIAILYGCFNLFALGFGRENYLWTYVLILGGLASIASIMAYMAVAFSPPGRSWAKMFSALSGYIPYFYSLYLLGFLGVYSLWLLVADHFSIGRLFFGIIWTVLGSRMLYTFWIITELGEARSRQA